MIKKKEKAMNRTKKSIKALGVILFITALCLSTPACNKMEEPTAPEETVSDGEITEEREIPSEERPIATLKVGFEEDSPKVDINQYANGILHTRWQEGDKLCVGRDAGTEEQVYTINPGFTDHKATFSGTALAAGSSFYIIYSNEYPTEHTYNYILYTRDYNGLRQVGNNNTAHLKYSAMITGSGTVPSEIKLTDTFAEDNGYTLYKSGVIKFYLRLPDEAVSPSRIECKAGKVGAVEGSDYIFHTTNQEDANLTNTISLYLSDVTPNREDKNSITAYMAIPWCGYTVQSGQTFTLSVYYTTESGDHKVVSKEIAPEAKTFSGGATIAYQYSLRSNSTTEDVTGGEGTADYPHLLSTPEDLLGMREKLINGEKVYFKMTDDIDMSGIANWEPLNNNEVLGFNRYIDFDGDGHLIKNLRCADKSYASFFGVLCGACHNTGFVNARVGATGTPAGIVAAFLGLQSPTLPAQTGRIEGCYTSGTVRSDDYGCGGLAGRIGAKSTESSAITNCYSSALVHGNSGCGGLAGLLYNGTEISGSYFCGTIVSQASWAGGIAGRAYNYTYSTKPIISNCAALTKTMYAPKTEENTSVLFRISHINNGSIVHTNCRVWDRIRGGVRNTSDTQACSSISEIQALFSTTPWHSTTRNGDYPLLDWQVTRGDYATWAGQDLCYFDDGNGSEGNPYQISQPWQLCNVDFSLNVDADKYFKIADDIDLTLVDNWIPINKDEQDKRIHLDGNHKTLSNLTYSCTEDIYAGLFSILRGEVSDLELQAFNVTQNGGKAAGILAGFLSTVDNGSASVKGVTITGGCITMNNNWSVGSLAGYAGKSVTLSDCSSNATVTQNSQQENEYRYCSGGLIGCVRTDGTTFSSCRYSGTLNSYRSAGGILGFQYNNSCTMEDCRFDGIVNCRARTGDKALKAEYAGGIIGNSTGGTVTRCSSSGTITGDRYLGGIIGYHSAGTLNTSESYFSGGTIESTDYAGGILGGNASNASRFDIVISDCYSRGSISATGQGIGGIVGDAYDGLCVEYCISDCTLQAQRTCGGIVGRAANGSWNGSNSNIKVDHCICWSSSISATNTGLSNGSSGAVIGYASPNIWMYCCYYNPNMTWSVSSGGVDPGNNPLVEQNPGGGYNATGDYAGPMVDGDPGTDFSHYKKPYHGGAAPAVSSSACTVAWDLGFQDCINAQGKAIWTIFNKGVYHAGRIMPELRNNRETSDDTASGVIGDMNKNEFYEEGSF